MSHKFCGIHRAILKPLPLRAFLLLTLCFVASTLVQDHPYLLAKSNPVGLTSSCRQPQESLLSNDGSKCLKEFVGYIPSTIEKTWSNLIRQVQSNDVSWGSGCTLINQQITEIEAMLSALSKYDQSGLQNVLSSSHFSRSEYRDTCTGHKSVVYIEPLMSFLRHPLALCPTSQKAADVLDKTYLLVPFQDEVTSEFATKWLFDAGASTYDTGAGGASQSWFVNKYRSRGIEFDRIIGWEAAVTDPALQWNSVPADVKRKTSWFNVPVTTGKDDDDNPFTFIKHMTKPEDFVVLKIDIDTPEVEMKLVRQLMDDPHLLTLVDEFYFEHHVSGSPMQWHGWGDLQSSAAPFSTLAESYEMFSRLRRQGVRAHSWV